MAEYRVLNEKLGIQTHGNPVTVSPSTLRVGDNWECVRDNVYRKPRGREVYGSGLPAQNISQFMDYKDRLFVHMANNTLYYDSTGTGTFLQKTGTYVVPETGYLVQSVEQAGNLYFTTSEGLKKLDSLSGTVVQAGCAQGLDCDLRLVTGTWFDGNNKAVAYRHVWAIYDANSNKVFGGPSERQTIENTSGGAKAVSLHINLPEDITANHYLEVYRTSIVASGTVPPEDFQLCYQARPTPAQITAGYLSFTDSLPDGFRGASLYTNTTQEGIQAANARPPKANSITTYKDYTFYGNIESIHRLYFNMVAVSGLAAGTSSLTITDGTTTLTLGCVANIADKTVLTVADNTGLCEVQTTANHGYTSGDYVRFLDVTGVGFGAVVNENIYEVTVTGLDKFTIAVAWVATYTALAGTVDFYEDIGASPRFVISGSATVSIAVDETARSIIRCLNQCSGNTKWYAYYQSGYDDVVGKILFTGDSVGVPQFYLNVNNAASSTQFTSPVPWSSAVSATATAGGLIKITTGAAHGLSSNDTVLISAVGGTVEANGSWTITVVDATNFTLNGSVYVNAWTAGGLVRPKDYKSLNDDFQNAVMWSKVGQVEHVPLINLKKLGSADDPILKVVGLKDSLFVIKKKDGIIRMTGETDTGFSFDDFDNTVECSQKNSIAKGQNAIFMFTPLGYSKISDVGVEVVGRANEFKDLIPSFSTNFETDGYGWFYEEEKSYFIATHADTDSTSNDTLKVYNTFTDAWMTRVHGVYTNDPFVKLGRVVAGRMYTAEQAGSRVFQERKSYTTTDFAAPYVANTITAIDPLTLQITLGTNVTVPLDSVVQQGSLNIRVTDVISTSKLELATINNLAVNMTVAVAGCANNGAGLIRVTTAAPHGLVTDNSVTIAGVTGTTEANGNWTVVRIDATNIDLVNSIFLNAWAGGGTVSNAITIIPGIISTLRYQAIHCGTPEYEKQFTKLVAFFDDDETRVTNVELNTSTDLDTAQVLTNLFEGTFAWGVGSWGAVWGTPVATDRMATYIPEEHSRGTYLDVEFIHRRPRQQCAVCGFSLIYEVVDTRLDT